MISSSSMTFALCVLSLTLTFLQLFCSSLSKQNKKQ